MSKAIGVVMDPIGSVSVRKDSSLAMMLAAQRRGWPVWYMELDDLFYAEQSPMARMRRIEVRDDAHDWYRFLEQEERPLNSLAAVLMRKDPPFDMEYIYATYLLELAHRQGTLIVNDPGALRDANEKVFITHFAHCAPPTLITRRMADLDLFLATHGDVILKPLGGMGGTSVFRVRPDDPNRNVIGEVLTARGTRFCMAQRFLPEIRDGDKRVLVVDGEPVPYALARIPREGETRGNLAAGAHAEARPLTDRDRWIANQVGPELRRRGILFAGLDVIGDYLTEINVTSPTCIRELDAALGLDIAGDLMSAIARRLGEHSS